MTEKALPSEASHPPQQTTVILSGNASLVSMPVSSTFRGGLLHVSQFRIHEVLSYEQHWDHLLFNASLSGNTTSSPRRGKQPGEGGHDASGTISVAPSGWDRRGCVSPGDILGLQLGLENWFVEEACEQSLGTKWRAANNAPDTRAFAMARQMAIAASSRAYDRLTLDTLALALARHLAHAYGAADRRRDDGWLHPAALMRVIAELRENPAQTPSLSDLSRVAGLGVSAFIRAFRGSVGTTPAAFALSLRLDLAAEMLAADDSPIDAIACATGFASASHLIRTFRLHHGVTPARWRRLHSG